MIILSRVAGWVTFLTLLGILEASAGESWSVADVAVGIDGQTGWRTPAEREGIRDRSVFRAERDQVYTLLADASKGATPTQQQQNTTAKMMMSRAKWVGSQLAQMDYCAPGSSAAMRTRAMEIAQRTGAEPAARFQEQLQASYDFDLTAWRKNKPSFSFCDGDSAAGRAATLEGTFGHWNRLLGRTADSQATVPQDAGGGPVVPAAPREGAPPAPRVDTPSDAPKGSPTAQIPQAMVAMVIGQAPNAGKVLAEMDYCVPESSTAMRTRARKIGKRR